MKDDMSRTYLSPAFSKRTEEELEFLRKVDGTTGFSLFWIDIVRPLLCGIKAEYLLEIGADEGENTQLLSGYCETFNATLTVIDPVLKPSLQEVISSSKKIKMIVGKSHDILPTLDQPVDAVFLEGDLNYYTTYGDFVAIRDLTNRQSINFPTVFVRCASWPYARRDMYYDPQNLPKDAMHNHEKSGMSPWAPQLKEMMINYSFENAKREGGARNGVWTAVEDFVASSDLSLKIFALPSNHGLGVIYLENSKAEQFINQNFAVSEKIRLFLETCEIARLNEIIKRQQVKLQKKHAGGKQKPSIRNFTARTIRKLGQKVLKRIEK